MGLVEMTCGLVDANSVPKEQAVKLTFFAPHYYYYYYYYYSNNDNDTN